MYDNEGKKKFPTGLKLSTIFFFFLSLFTPRRRLFNFSSAAPTTTRADIVKFPDRVFHILHYYYCYIRTLFIYYYIVFTQCLYTSIVLITANNFTDPPDRYTHIRVYLGVYNNIWFREAHTPRFI